MVHDILKLAIDNLPDPNIVFDCAETISLTKHWGIPPFEKYQEVLRSEGLYVDELLKSLMRVDVTLIDRVIPGFSSEKFESRTYDEWGREGEEVSDIQLEIKELSSDYQKDDLFVSFEEDSNFVYGHLAQALIDWSTNEELTLGFAEELTEGQAISDLDLPEISKDYYRAILQLAMIEGVGIDKEKAVALIYG